MCDTDSDIETENTVPPKYEFEGNTCVITTAYMDQFKTKNPFNDPTLMKLLGNKYTKINYDLVGIGINNIPNGVTHLNIRSPMCDRSVNNLPPSLIYLRIGGERYALSYFDQPLDFLPPGLKILILEYLEEYTHPLDNLPPNLEYLYIITRKKYDIPMNNLPTSLKEICIYDESKAMQGVEYPDIRHLWYL